MATLVEVAANLVAAHAAKTTMTTEELLAEIEKVHTALKKLEGGQSLEETTEAKAPLMVKDAFKKHEVICLECGAGGFKTLTRHLSTAHQMKPGAYKKKHGIPATQSLSAKSYSEARRQMAQERGLADNLAKAREVRMAKLEAKKAPARGKGGDKAAKPAKPAKTKKSSAKATA
ncbi:MucR family transcriptional regulator [Geomonas sp. RF6]|uniref:MucR family transcriptional regulator n=1 Tax=Geomonas sp. RF6 TaxID=2897342 RepID=UPI001E54D8DE|nr:MucR family transcriptional regulator [Geomonas sp. RF6]UFS70639.1 MucR family transcriptional regulator [Geomonas sp. RF6]